MGKVLFVSWTVPPQKTGSSIIINNLACQFKSDEIIVVGEKVNQIPSPTDYKIYYLDPFIKIFKKGEKYTKWLKAHKIINELTAIAKNEKCTSVLAVFPDEFYLYIAYRVSKKLNLPFYTWFHNTYLDNRKGILLGLAYILQPRIFKHARQNFVMSDGMKSYYEKKYPSIHFESLVHPFEIPSDSLQPIPPVTGPIKFAFTGALNESCLDASLRLFNILMENPNFEIHIFTGQSENEFKKYGIDGPNIKFHGFVSDAIFISKLSECHILLLPHGFEGKRSKIEYETIFPTRTIPLLYSNRPILAHSPEGSFLTKFLINNDCAEVVVSKEKHEIIQSIDRLLNSHERQMHIVKNAMKISQIFKANEVSNFLKKIIQ